MTESELRAFTAVKMPERQLSENVRQLCKVLGLLAYHPHRSDHSAAGWPDWAICVGDTLFLRELKSATGKLSPDQLRWLTALGQVRTVSAGVWKPQNWLDGTIERELRRKNGMEP